ncbi:hypothetical protein LOTGIDRAFT_234990 [Lottia gigantea]|uniref:C-type lectin domain-containing protein n=1 Tax=Lottia gigantea TaxID=225164 RepID=V3Z9W9_LOTGI|nr:hypothetical protein LOTGIDRAFT_234990 [Lottia gigantea]ESO87768.1 hypothetical protein LOTGIDRAFT_234990 [Lottia gigantea]
MVSWSFVAALTVATIATVYCVLPEQFHECVKGCPSGFFYFDDSCYVIPRIKVSWGQAVGYCRALDSELLTIETAAEQEFLAQELKKHHGKMFWFAAQDMVVEGIWRWTRSLSPVLLKYWRKAQPDNRLAPDYIHREHCGAIAEDGWSDELCNDEHYFICEKPSW